MADGERSLLCLKEFKFPVQGQTRTFKPGDRLPESAFRTAATAYRQQQMLNTRFVQEEKAIIVTSPAPKRRGRPPKAKA